MTTWSQASMMVIGRIKWQTPIILTSQFRRAVASTNTRAAQSPEHLDKRAAQDATKKRLVELRQEADAQRPIHMIYILGSNNAFTTWKRGQTRSIHSVVQRVGLYVYTPDSPVPNNADDSDPRAAASDSSAGPQDLSASYVGLEMVLHALPDAPIHP